jgi:hypothetical protein
LLPLIALLIGVTPNPAATPAAAAPSEGLPIREVTVFKDGHALVLRRGAVTLNDHADAVLTDLPRPVMGTFWAECDSADARLASVRVERVDTQKPTPAANITDLLAANIGRAIRFRTRADNTARVGTVIDVLTHEPAPTADPIVIVRTAADFETIRIARLTDLRFVRGNDEPPATTYARDIEQERMTLDLDWKDDPGDSADVSLMYLQRGLRWIPSYRITMLDDERVRIELQGTLVNELADLENATLHLAVGVPAFAFEHTPDPIGLHESLDQLGLFFQKPGDHRTGSMLSHALRTQSARMTEMQAHASGMSAATPPEMTGGDRAEDLFVFTIDNVTLAKGARMVTPIASYECGYSSLYRLDLPAGPPFEVLPRLDSREQREIALLLDRPIATHVLRIAHENEMGYPITTAPALVIRNGLTLAQGLITYTPDGSGVDLEVGKAIDIGVDLDERETGREPDAVKWRSHDYARIDLAMEATLTNRKAKPVTIEVRRLAFGHAEEVNNDGESVALSIFDVERRWSQPGAWWRAFGWPHYWHALNGAAEFRWQLELDPGEAATLEASWHYFWR